MNSDQTIEQRILIVMRKVLARIIKDVTPPPGMQHPLTSGTVDDIRACLALIAARERELFTASSGEQTQERPHYSDAPPAATIVPFSINPLRKSPPTTTPDPESGESH
jgi:hypothetical protein